MLQPPSPRDTLEYPLLSFCGQGSVEADQDLPVRARYVHRERGLQVGRELFEKDCVLKLDLEHSNPALNNACPLPAPDVPWCRLRKRTRLDAGGRIRTLGLGG